MKRNEVEPHSATYYLISRTNIETSQMVHGPKFPSCLVRVVQIQILYEERGRSK